MSEKNVNLINTYRQQLMFLSQQKQQIQLQKTVLENTLKELEATQETNVYKGVGNIFVLKQKTLVVKETQEGLESLSLRLKTLENQESETLKKISDLTHENQERKAKEPSPVLKEAGSDGIA